ncbi:putative 26S proteasome regulatory subunit [Blastocladiella emersonii ATCC 22665]|nr:putative 26S proteasome regulatory subunit [Blastocladiella emersonii ATCC 22665]
MMSTTAATTEPASRDAALAHARALMAEKDALEADLTTMHDVLKSHKVSVDDPLVDAQGFPRADVDVYAIRKLRTDIISRRNDLKDMYKRIEAALLDVHKFPAEPAAAPPANGGASSRPTRPFARVNAVSPDSPASAAGLKRGDHILGFGSLDATNHDSLKALLPLVAAHENRALAIIVQRESETLTLSLTPRKWGGRGLLGCHIVPSS